MVVDKWRQLAYNIINELHKYVQAEAHSAK